MSIEVYSQRFRGRNLTQEEKFDNLREAVKYCNKYGERKGRKNLWITEHRMMWISEEGQEVKPSRINGVKIKR